MSNGLPSSSGSPSITNSNADGTRHDDTTAAPEPSRSDKPKLPREHGGRDGPEPTRFGDWEKAGRCIDF